MSNFPSFAKISSSIDRAIATSVGRRYDDSDTYGPSILSWLVHTGSMVPPWWSFARDKYLSNLWKSSNHLSIAMYTAQAKMVTIPPRIVARDQSNSRHVTQAEEMTNLLLSLSDFGKGWDYSYSAFIEDLLGTDNGGFMEIIGDGEPGGPIEGAPIAVRHLDSQRCWRTASPIYPVVYMDEVGQRYKLHYTRVISLAQMPSARSEMNGVGFSAVSRACDIAQTLIDYVVYKQEKLGSRPQSQMLVGQGITATQIMQAIYLANEQLNNAGLTRYAKIIALGSENTEIGVEKVDLTASDPMNEELTVTLGMFTIAAAFGIDAIEIWPTGGSSANQADAALRHLRSRGKLPAQTTAALEAQFNAKFLPPHLRITFDFRDDAEDQQRAVVQDIRGRNRERDIGTNTVSIRVARQRMLEDGDISREKFVDMELSDGRLEDGRPIGLLFFSEDVVLSRLLNLGVDNPLDILGNDPPALLSAIARKRADLYREAARSNSEAKGERFYLATKALDWLEKQYAVSREEEAAAPPQPAREMAEETEREMM